MRKCRLHRQLGAKLTQLSDGKRIISAFPLMVRTSRALPLLDRSRFRSDWGNLTDLPLTRFSIRIRLGVFVSYVLRRHKGLPQGWGRR